MDLTGREIFATGKWNEMEFSEADLDDIVANFEKLADIHKVPLKFGHNDEQAMTDGKPAIGWVSKIYREGKKLLADFTDVPKSVYEAIKKKLYRTVSVELLFDVDHKDSRYNHILDAVALLGADHPAVNTLADLDSLLATRTSFAGGRKLCFETIAGNKTTKLGREVKDMDDEKLKSLIAEAVKQEVAPLNDALEKVTKERDEYKRASEEAIPKQAELDAEAEKQKIAATRKEVGEILDNAVREKSMTPAQREVYAKQIGLTDEKKVLEIDLDAVKSMCRFTDKKDSNVTRIKPRGGDEITGDPSKDLTHMTFAFMAEHNVKDFSRALDAVARANPDLHRDWLNANREA